MGRKIFTRLNGLVKTNYTQSHNDNVFATRNALYKAGDFVEVIFADDHKICEIAAFLWRAGISQHAKLVNYLDNKAVNTAKFLNYYAKKVKKYHPEYPEYKIPEISTLSDWDWFFIFLPVAVIGMLLWVMWSILTH